MPTAALRLLGFILLPTLSTYVAVMQFEAQLQSCVHVLGIHHEA